MALSDSEASKSTVMSLAKGFRVLEVFDAREPELTLSQIATRAELDPGTTFRLVKTLVMLGYLHPADGKRYRLGLKVLDLGFNAFGRMELATKPRGHFRLPFRPLCLEAAQ